MPSNPTVLLLLVRVRILFTVTVSSPHAHVLIAHTVGICSRLPPVPNSYFVGTPLWLLALWLLGSLALCLPLTLRRSERPVSLLPAPPPLLLFPLFPLSPSFFPSLTHTRTLSLAIRGRPLSPSVLPHSPIHPFIHPQPAAPIDRPTASLPPPTQGSTCWTRHLLILATHRHSTPSSAHKVLTYPCSSPPCRPPSRVVALSAPAPATLWYISHVPRLVWPP